ncbi:Ppx/GppA family phosphatase [Romboutsia sp. CE17]|uniref:Ppx/GppA phosphatase family protein n=1 Tax=Romboutsia sp. CE17 TaxID=2724150 RepID=UPI001442D64F|nr:Ppx/GppA phosphatase family protein [Romboutsia sp. CE17]QJA09941.1 Ppx/GppA family phosphatase [Romboutsia sp. CE17]
MKIGAIDIGTNSMRLLVCDFINDELLNRKKFVNTTRIGKGVDEYGFISQEAIRRNIDALKEFYKLSKSEGCDYIYCIGTSALRDSKNGDDFVRIAKEEIDIDIEIISGEEESNLGFLGVLKGANENDDILVIDIGGGSTEFILGNMDGIKFSKSENVGALRMTEKFLTTDIVDNYEFDMMSEFIENEIRETLESLKEKHINKLVGIGGTITSLSAINQELEVYSMEKIHNSVVTIDDIENILQNLKKMTLNDKKSLKGLQSKRADIITAGVKILHIIMEKLELREIIVSEYDNLEGLICLKSKKLS